MCVCGVRVRVHMFTRETRKWRGHGNATSRRRALTVLRFREGVVGRREGGRGGVIHMIKGNVLQ